MIDEKKILQSIDTFIYKRDVDFSTNIFLCGAETSKKDSIRNLLNLELQKDAKFNTVYPEYIFANLFGKGGHNLLELEDELAKNVEIIIMPLEGIGTLCELGAFVMNPELLTKIIAVYNGKFKNNNSFINLGPIDLIKKKNKKNLIIYEEGREKEIIPLVIERIRYRRFEKKITYDLENIFNLSRFILYLIAVFQPITKEKIKHLISLVQGEKIKMKHIESSIQILTQKNRIEGDIEAKSLEHIYYLSKKGHNYFYEELLEKLKVKQHFTKLRLEIINNQNKRYRKDMGKDIKLLV